jgi:hypothetical protein
MASRGERSDIETRQESPECTMNKAGMINAAGSYFDSGKITCYSDSQP